ncbi:hypothetical protein K443DRAFT_107548, partial [Laccaria amethystina LaAM-08-1]
LRKLREGATTLVSWEKSPKKEGTYPKREIDTETLQKNTDRLQKLQSLLMDYKTLPGLYIYYKYPPFQTTKVCSVCFLSLQKLVVSTF